MKLRFVYIILGLLVFVSVLLSRAPASLINIPMQGKGVNFSFSQAHGSLWNGELDNVVVNGIHLGQVKFILSPITLLTLRAKLELTIAGGAISGNGSLVVNSTGVHVHSGDFNVLLSRISNKKVFDIPVTGLARVKLDNTRISKKGCRFAEGTIWTDFLTIPSQQFGAKGFVLEGPLRCENNDLLVTLNGSGEEAEAHILVTMRPDLSYSMLAQAVPKRREVAEALAFLGFQESEGGLNYELTGNLYEATLK